MKRKVIALLLTTAMAMSLAACGGTSSGGNDSSKGGSSGGDSAESNVLTVWTWDPNFNVYAIEKAAEIYAKDHYATSFASLGTMAASIANLIK